MLRMWKQTGMLAIQRAVISFNCITTKWSRNYSCTGKTTKSDTSKQIKAQGSENEERMRVRRARVADVTRVLRFVRENCRNSWPGLQPTTTLNLVLNDYVARTLAQGHSMVAEQHLPRRGWAHMRGLALCTSTCPWDSALLDKWARCIKCQQSRQLISFTAHCMRIPVLHEKYNLPKILQTMVIVPKNVPKRAEIVRMLVENAIKRGRDDGFQLLRFDVTNPQIAEMLEKLNLTKEWEGNFVAVPKCKLKDTPLTFEGSPDLLKEPCHLESTTEHSIKVKLIHNHRETPFVLTGIVDQPKSGLKDSEALIKESLPIPMPEPIKSTNTNFPNYLAVYSIFIG